MKEVAGSRLGDEQKLDIKVIYKGCEKQIKSLVKLGILKSEAFYGIQFSDEAELRKKIEEYIFFYNNERLQTNLKGMTPNMVRYHSGLNVTFL